MVSPSNDSAPFILVRTRQREVAAFSIEPLVGWLPIAKAALGAHVFGPRDSTGQVYSRYFTLRPSDINAWDKLTHHGVGDGYAYAVGWNSSGKISKVFSVREIPPPAGAIPGIDPLTLANAAALAQIKACIDRLTELVERIGLDVRDILTFLHNEQQASVLAAVETIDDIYEAYRREGSISGTDWSRISGLEQVIKQQHRQVLLELSEIASDLEFSNIAEAERSLARNPERVRHLITLEYYLLRALNRWTALMLARKEQQGEATRESIATARATTDRYTKHARAALHAICAANTRDVHWRGFFEMLFTDGLVLGARKDESIEKNAKANRTAIQAELKPNALPTRATRRPRLFLAA